MYVFLHCCKKATTVINIKNRFCNKREPKSSINKRFFSRTPSQRKMIGLFGKQLLSPNGLAWWVLLQKGGSNCNSYNSRFSYRRIFFLSNGSLREATAVDGLFERRKKKVTGSYGVINTVKLFFSQNQMKNKMAAGGRGHGEQKEDSRSQLAVSC